QTERLGRSIMELEGALKPQIGQLGERITAISEQIIEKLGEKSGLSDEIEAVKASISSSMDQLSRQITTISEATAAIAEKANQDSMRQAMDLLAAHVQQAQAASSAMKRDFSAALSAIGDALQKTLDAQGTKIEGVSTKIDEA
ncbi:MAG: hypothetical protein HQK97_09220, partial [Nitrospirae bacterium]|nr:hypothetical protein [Nitrospirota bacterium]